METIDLRCESYDMNGMLDDAWTKYRLSKLKEFLARSFVFPKKALFIGHSNDFDDDLAKFLGVEYEFTTADLDEPFPIHGIYDYVLCLDVLEHLMNPLTLLKRLKSLNCPVVISYPRHPFAPFWGRCHFHEFSERAFYTLITAAGFKVVKHSKFSCRKEWWKFFNGFRPVLRFLLLLIGYPKHEIYIIG